MIVIANTTLGNPGGGISNITLQGDNNSFIQDNIVRKEATLSILPLYLLDSDETDVFDFGGTIKLITLNGVFIGATESNVKTFVDKVEDLIQGHQDTNAAYPLTFTDDRRGTGNDALKVKVMSFESIFVAGYPTACTWNLKLVQSSTNA